MTNLIDLLTQETATRDQRLSAGRPTGKEELREVLDLLTAIHRASTLVTKFCPELVMSALKSGIPQADLVGRPYHETQVRRLAREAEVPKLPTGRRPRVRPAQ